MMSVDNNLRQGRDPLTTRRPRSGFLFRRSGSVSRISSIGPRRHPDRLAFIHPGDRPRRRATQAEERPEPSIRAVLRGNRHSRAFQERAIVLQFGHNPENKTPPKAKNPYRLLNWGESHAKGSPCIGRGRAIVIVVRRKSCPIVRFPIRGPAARIAP